AARFSPITQLPQFRGSIHQGVAKLTAAAPMKVRTKVNNLARALRIQIDSPVELGASPKCLSTLIDATVERRCVRICYEDDKRNPRQTKVSPYLICAASDGWKLVGRSTWHRAVINIFIDQI